MICHIFIGKISEGIIRNSAGYQPRLGLYDTIWLEGGSGMTVPYSMMSIIQVLQVKFVYI